MYPPASGLKYVPVRFRLVSLLLVFSFLALSIPQGIIRITQTAEAASPNVVISQVYGGGGNAGATYKNDFIELFNRGTTTVNLAGWSVQYASSAGTSWAVTPLTGSIAPGKYYLVQEAVGAGGTLNLPTPVDATGTIAMSATAGKVAVVNSTTALTGGCPAAVDFVGFGGANCFEGVGPTATLTNTTAAIRAGAGCTDTDVNSADFTTGAPNPRNSATPAATCGVTNNPPTINAISDPAKTVNQGAPAFTLILSGNDDGGIYQWGATAGAGISAVSVSSGGNTSSATFSVTLDPAFSGTATFNATLTDGVTTPASRTVNIAVTPTVVNAVPSIGAVASPYTTVAQDAAPFTVNLTGSDDNNVFNWSATAGAGVASAVVSAGQGTSAVTYSVTLTPGFSGTATLNAVLSDGVNPQVTQPVNVTVTPAPPPPLDHIVISQVYGGGGNASAAFQNDFVELYNPDTVEHDLSGWTIQYGAATGTTWQVQPLGGTMQPGEYYLIKLATNGAVGSVVPDANINGSINMSGSNGKVALSSAGDAFDGCPVGDPTLVDLVGYGSTANCREGATNAPTLTNALADFRKNGGLTDTNVNGSDFVTGTPNPRRTTPIVELPPTTLSSDPRNSFSNVPRDASITVNFTEAVDISAGWFNISCVATGLHNDATVAPGSTTVASGGATSWIIIPNVNFQPGEQCTATVFKEFVHDSDTDDGGPNTDLLTKNYSTSFTISTGTAPAYGPEVNMAMGNPNGAEADLDTPNNYLMVKPEFTLSYNRDRGTPNWVSWHLADEWVGSLVRVDTFRADPAVPPDWYRVTHVDYTNSGFDRGHMTPNADRDKETSSPINQATFLMTNMVPQAPDNNQGPWANMENYLRTLLPANELYIVSGPAGIGGFNSASPTATPVTTIAGGHITVPASTWKVALVIPKGDNDVARVGTDVRCNARTIAVIMPNVQGIRNNDWQGYITTVDAVESLTGYDFFSNLPDAVQACVEAGRNGVNPPGAEDDAFTTAEDTYANVTLTGLPSGAGTLSYNVISEPAHGTLSGTGAERVYTPAQDFNGTDSFTFNVSVTDANGTRTSRTATVSLLVTAVNDAPTLAPIAPKAVTVGDTLTFTAVGADIDLPAQSLSYSLTGDVPQGASIGFASGEFSWTPTAEQAGHVYSFGVSVTDGSLSAEQPVSVTVSHPWSGFLQPVNLDGSSIFKLGRTVPIKFQLTGASAGVTDAVVRLFVKKVSNTVTGTVEEEAVSTSGATEGNLFRYADGSYIFNLSTTGLSKGTYQLRIDMGDGVQNTVNVSLR